MAPTFSLPLGQLVDLLPDWGWYALIAGGMLAPIVGLSIAIAARSAAKWKWVAVVVFYLVSLPSGGPVLLGRASNPGSVCVFYLLLPVGIIIGLVVLVPRNRVVRQRGFEVQQWRKETDE